MRLSAGVASLDSPMKMNLFALLRLNLRIRWREWRACEADGVLLQQMRALWAADVIRPRRYRNLRLVPNPAKRRWTLRRIA
jgi:hypothetical protein